MHFLDVLTGWGRLIFRVALKLKYRFQSYEGVDINESCMKQFEKLTKIYSCKRRNIDVKFILRNVLDFDSQKKYALITASWFLGFFGINSITKIL